MQLSDQRKKLFSEFPPVSTQEWEEKIKADLKGADYENKLIWKTDEGFDVKPYYRSENLQGLEYLQSLSDKPCFARGNKRINNNWLIRQDIPVCDIKEANRIALDAVQKGAGSLNFCAVEIANHKQMNRLLANINLLETEINFMSSRSYPLTLELFIYEVNYCKINSEKIHGSLNFDPISYLLLHGDFYISKENNFEEAEYLLKTIQKKLPEFKAFTVNGHYFREAGSTIVQELAFSLASANEYLFELTSRGISIDSVARNLIFSLGTGSDYFLEIAKLRAIRLLWPKIVEQYQPKQKESLQMFIHSNTVLRNKTIYDPYVNMLRSTTEGMAAVIGNSDSISISPFDLAFREPDDFSARIARNQQQILKEEAHLDKVIDASAGSYYIENLTHSLMVHSWDLFLKIEERGGFIESVKSGFVQDEIETACMKKERDIEIRKAVMIGTNQYPNPNESVFKIVSHTPAKVELESSGKYKKINLSRFAEPFEILRLATENHIASGKKKPVVYLLSFGNLTMRKARAAFTINFFGCAGYEILEDRDVNKVEEGIKNALDSNAEIVVICSSDEEYAAVAPAVAEEIKRANPTIKVIIAGYPKDIVENLKIAGVDDFIHIKSNVVETLTRYHKMLGII
jgi:methylmalonyl-CoA mutase